MPTIKALSDREIQILQGMINRVRALRGNTSNRPDSTESDQPSPEVYIAKTPTEGISALDSLGTGTGSGAPAAAGDSPGSALCNIYTLSPASQPTSAGSPSVLVEVVGLSKWVFNLSDSDIAGDSWILVVKDKFGSWIAVTGGGGGTAGEPLRFVKVLEEEGVDGYYQVRLMTELADGSLLDDGRPEDEVWYYDANELDKIEMGKVMGPCKKTGVTDGMSVYTFSERKAFVQKETGSSRIGPNIHTWEFAVRNHWTITEPEPGVARIKPARLTVTRSVCEADGLHTWVFIDGWLAAIDPTGTVE